MVGKKIVIEKPGDYTELKLQEFPDLIPGRGEVCIRTKAIGVNFADCCVRMGVYSSAKEFIGWPITPGFEVSGVVSAVGEGVTRFKVGDRVIAVTFFGGYASQVVAREALVFPLPAELSFEKGAALPVVFLTAFYALHELVHPHPGDLLLVHSAAGGVGSLLVQLGKLSGCKVAAVVGASHKVDEVKRLQADFVIDKSTEDLWKQAESFAPGGFDAIFDANGVETLNESYRHLSKGGGKLVVYGFHTMFSKGRGKPNWIKMAWDYLRTPRFNPLYMTNENRSVMAFNLSYLFDKVKFLEPAFALLMKEFSSGRLKPPRITCYPLEKTGSAQKDLESGNTVGKLILIP